MMQPPRLHLFQAFGVELEYMIVDRDSLNVLPIADELLKAELGEYRSDFENGIVTWSNELVLHVIEMKSTRPESNFNTLASAFSDNIARANKVLEKWNAMLLSTAAHPWMNPQAETKLWPHDSNEVYDRYNTIFDCKGHGWSNLQSTHLASDGGNHLLVGLVEIHPGVEEACKFTVQDWRACTQCRKNWKNYPDRRVEFRKLFIVIKGKV